MPVSLYEARPNSLPVFHVDAFTNQAFRGNPAAVCPLDRWLDDDWMQRVAAENNLSETAFFVADGQHYGLRWFTPVAEVNLCGHATLASAYVLMNVLNCGQELVRFSTRSGMLTVRRDGKFLDLDLPSWPPWVCEKPPAELFEALRDGPAPEVVMQIADNYFVVYESEDVVRGMRPGMMALEKVHPAGVAITAPGKDCDFVSRYFVPSYGIPEDPVTGSTHCSLAPYWGARLGKTRLHARQVSERGGELWCEVAGEWVVIRGEAVLVLRGEWAGAVVGR